MPKQVAVIGLGRFGGAVARELYQMGHDVLAIDRDERVTQDLVGQVTYAVAGNAISAEFLEEVGIKDVDAAVVAVGVDIQSSVLITVLLKQRFHVKKVVARANDDLHGQALQAVGADRVAYVEQEAGRRTAHSLFYEEVIEHMDLTPRFGFSKIVASSHLVGKSLEQAGFSGLRDKYGASVIAIKRGREPILAPSKEEVIQPGDVLVIAGWEEVLEKVRAG
ncbi:MAG: TrkA family potassium uptake protein [Chloroflexi bacterium]|nr:TrkA family potassium uptake protein [Chloroflexota bacterium]